MNGRRNLHDLLVHPIYTTPQQHGNTSASTILPLIQHDLQSLESPLPHIAPIHVPPLIPISPTTAGGTSVESPSGNPTLTTLEGSHTTHGPADSSHSSPPGVPCQTSSQSATVQQPQGQPQGPSLQGESMVPFYTQLTPIHSTHATPGNETPGPVPAPAARGGRKRKSSGSGGTTNGKMVHVKQEPGAYPLWLKLWKSGCLRFLSFNLIDAEGITLLLGVITGFSAEMSPSDSTCSNNNGSSNGNSGNGGQVDDDYFDFSGDPSMFLDSNYQCIKFQSFQENNWHTLTDEAFKEL